MGPRRVEGFYLFCTFLNAGINFGCYMLGLVAISTNRVKTYKNFSYAMAVTVFTGILASYINA